VPVSRRVCLVALPLVVAAFSVLPSPAGAAPLVHGWGRRAVCAEAGAHQARCHSHVVTDGSSRPLASVSPSSSALPPSDLWGAYGLSTTFPPTAPAGGAGQTVAIVDAYDNPNAAKDLLAYRKYYNLRLCSDGTVSCLFTKVNQSGAASPLPAPSTSWGQEIDLDIEMASAVCPNCNILLVEARSSYFSDLVTAVDTAARLNANAISNSYGGGEFSGEAGSAYDGHFNHPGVAMTVSSGDSGYGVQFPAASRYVTAVGGTSLTYNRTTGARSETAWSGAGSGCSAYIAQPAWQAGLGSCANRTVADVSAVADPATGVTVYDSYGSRHSANWYVFGGTSVASPVVAGVFALAGTTGPSPSGASMNAVPYATYDKVAKTSGSLWDVTSGSNGTCTSTYLCTAVTGYDGPTGLGTPRGTTGF